MRPWNNILVALVFVLTGSNNCFGAKIETLLMPGKLVSSHAEYEEECSKCHQRFKQESQVELCLDCHTEINKDIKYRHGFHGRSPNIQDTECKTCHTDHIGRQADIVGLNTELFDHTFTDFRLTGSHPQVRCSQCHKKGIAYSKAPHNCIDCHKSDDIHDAQLGKQCDDCHKTSNWKDNRFDHNKTKFLLTGKHVELSCTDCHIDQQYENTERQCIACHTSDDVHNGINGQKCQDCHSTSNWKKVKFDHDINTEFKLLGKHRALPCTSCHKDDVRAGKLKTDCYSCHRGDDTHNGRNGPNCDNCHNNTDWKESDFDHSRDTDFVLKGRHKRIACSACHRHDPSREKIERKCYSCHWLDDQHKGQLGETCERCHGEDSWFDGIMFDHDITRFPLLGIHAVTPCQECHLSAMFKNTKGDCIACHKSDDIHKQSMGSQCAQCHNPNGWLLWSFEHSEATTFALTGAHQQVGCAACHDKPLHKQNELSKDCYDCHVQDDIHSGRFGKSCDRCHSTVRFNDLDLLKN